MKGVINGLPNHSHQMRRLFNTDYTTPFSSAKVSTYYLSVSHIINLLFYIVPIERTCSVWLVSNWLSFSLFYRSTEHQSSCFDDVEGRFNEMGQILREDAKVFLCWGWGGGEMDENRIVNQQSKRGGEGGGGREK